KVRILLRADSGFARDALMDWCEQNRVDFLFGLARNVRLEAQISDELAMARQLCEASARPARVFRDFRWRTLDSWSRERRVIGKAEWTGDKANRRFIVTLLKKKRATVNISTRRSTAPAARWKTVSRNASLICSPIAPPPTPCAPTNCVFGSPRWPMR